MSNHSETEGLLSGRLNQSSLKNNFSDLHPPLNKHEASVAADRCYFCHKAIVDSECQTVQYHLHQHVN